MSNTLRRRCSVQVGISRVFFCYFVLMVLGFTQSVVAEQITSTCRITGVDAAQRTVTLVRKAAIGEKVGIAKVVATAKITQAGKACELGSLVVPLEATVVYDTDQRVVVEIAIAPASKPSGSEPHRAIAPFDAAKAKEHQEAWAKYLGVPVETANSIGMKLVLIPPGEFEMGSSAEEIQGLVQDLGGGNNWYIGFLRSEGPRHLVRITSPARFGMAEVTVAQFREFVDAAGYRTDAEKSGKGGFGRREGSDQVVQAPEFTWRTPGFRQEGTHPVVQVSWKDAVAFCVWLSGKEGKHYRLPREAEWEYVCRAGTQTEYRHDEAITGRSRPPGNVADAAPMAKSPANAAGDGQAKSSSGADGYAFTSPVGKFEANPWGLFDMYGNVWEWCSDFYAKDYYAHSVTDDPAGPESGVERIRRGGCWNTTPSQTRPSHRIWAPPEQASDSVGFRVVCEVEKSK